jgi:hypothetical protein
MHSSISLCQRLCRTEQIKLQLEQIKLQLEQMKLQLGATVTGTVLPVIALQSLQAHSQGLMGRNVEAGALPATGCANGDCCLACMNCRHVGL